MSGQNAIPDPSVLTTEGIARATEWMGAVNEAKLEVLRERLAGMDLALKAAATTLEARLTAGDSQLLTHIEAQRVSVDTALISLNQLLEEKEKAIDKAEASRKEARDKAALDLQDKLREMNKFREQIAGERSHFITREGNEGELKQLNQMIDRNREDINRVRGEIVGKETYGNAVKEWGVWRSNIDRFMSEQQGRGEGVSSTGKAAIATIGAISLIMGIGSMVVSFSNRSDITRNTDKIYYATAPAQVAPAKVEVTNPISKPVPVKQPE